MVFVGNFANPTTTALVYLAPNGGVNVASQNANFNMVGASMPGACSFDALYVNTSPATATTSIADTITVTLYKNGVAQPVTTQVAVASGTTVGTLTSNSDTAHSFSVAAGDRVALGITQTDASQTIRMTVTSRCQ